MKFILSLVFFFLTYVLKAQNLVPNPSFEDTVSCPNDSSEISICIGWSTYGPFPDYFNSCNTTYLGVPNNFTGVQAAATGNAYFGLRTDFYVFPPNRREIIGRQLSTALVPGIKYFASVKVSLADRSFQAANNTGISFSTYSMAVDDTVQVFGGTRYPQIYSSSAITDYTNWITISGSFIADSAYKFIAIGNFLNDSLTTVVYSTSMASYYYGGAYYYIDDVCVSMDSMTCNSTGIREPQQVNVTIFPNPFSNQLTVSLANNEQARVILYDVSSRQILEQSFTASATINTAHLANGIYFYEVHNNKEVTAKGKVMKY